MGAVTFTIPGKPFAWRRARSFGKIRFKDKATEAHVDTLQAIALPFFPAPLDGPLHLSVTAVFAIPASWPKAKRATASGLPHTQKPDADNLVKQLGDGLNRIAWNDDSQVAEITVRKQWGDRAETVVMVEEL